MNSTTQADLYTTDFYAWTQEQARLIRASQWDLVDIANVVEEIETLGRTERRELGSRLSVLLGHLLKWDYQDSCRSNSWRATIREQRRQLKKVIKENPSLKPELPEFLLDAYESAVLLAMQETDLPETTFPSTCPYTWEQLLDDRFPSELL